MERFPKLPPHFSQTMDRVLLGIFPIMHSGFEMADTSPQTHSFFRLHFQSKRLKSHMAYIGGEALRNAENQTIHLWWVFDHFQ